MTITIAMTMTTLAIHSHDNNNNTDKNDVDNNKAGVNDDTKKHTKQPPSEK